MVATHSRARQQQHVVVSRTTGNPVKGCDASFEGLRLRSSDQDEKENLAPTNESLTIKKTRVAQNEEEDRQKPSRPACGGSLSEASGCESILDVGGNGAASSYAEKKPNWVRGW
ncbi:hypothetical protein AYL99_11960 [Fonsecaea erecta]|uniref:Uncharacterized protein n=1 Tax=Fonsecaea erecta TaxID=1367422 RepID=A0A178Z2A3_9EURO|nr:hypothetical protein AYL99_11960 [Fonsecaea erecta]OAP53837.1 hypothetical protein AYL99_11960 [Fonsecaea erecta]